MQKIMVIGCPGSGKSTFSRALGAIMGIEVVHLDMLYWNKDRTTVSKEVFRQRLSEAFKKESYIIDGNYGSTLEMRFAECDTVFFLDYSTKVCLDGVFSRRGKPRPDMPWIENIEPEDDFREFIEFIKNFKIDSRPIIMDLLKKYTYRNIITFSSREEADEFLRKIHNESY